jgi:hypothetical protein
LEAIKITAYAADEIRQYLIKIDIAPRVKVPVVAGEK